MAGNVGDKVGPRLAQLVGQYVLAARRDHAPLEARIRQVATQALIDKAGHEVGDHIAPLLTGAITANPDMHPTVRGYLERTASGQHQLQAIAGHLAIGAAGSVLSTLLSNELAPFAYQIVGANPHLRLQPADAAAAYAIGNFSQQDMYNEGAAGGFNSIRMDTLHALAQNVPGVSDLLDMVNRGDLSLQDLRYWLGRSAIPPALWSPLEAQRRQLLTVADAALAVLRSEISDAEGRHIAALNGMEAGDFEIFVANTGEPLALEQLGEALRRGFIDSARYTRGLEQSRVRNEWLDVALKLQFVPMSTADAIEAAVQGHLSIAEAQAKAAQNGLEASDFNPLYETAGEPLSRTELEQLFNRGLIDQATVEQGLRESRLKNKYIADAFQLHVRLPEPRQVVAMISHGVITKQRGIEYLMESGFSAQTAADLIAEGSATRLSGHHLLTVAEIRQLFTEGIFNAAEAQTYLGGLGYDAADSAHLLDIWRLLAGAAIVRQAIGFTRTRYVARHITESEARQYLHSLNVGAAAVDNYVAIWNLERDAAMRQLTEAQIVKAHKDGLITGQDAHDRLTAFGYTDGDANILLGVKPGDPIPP